MYQYEYKRPMVTVTVVLFYKSDLIYGIRRGPTEAGKACHPGGFVNEDEETCRQAAVREVKEETNLDLRPEDLYIVNEYSDPATDPRGHVVNIAYYAIVRNLNGMVAGDDLVTLVQIPLWRTGELDEKWAFNHKDILYDAEHRASDF
jgi:8-oxo-dGTP diphosphatase